MTKLAKVAQQVSEESEIPLDPAQASELALNNPDLLIDGQNSQQVEGGTLQEKLPFMKIDQDLLAGEYEFQIKVGSTRHLDENTEKADAMLLGNMAADNPLINRAELTKVLFEKFGFGHLVKAYLFFVLRLNSLTVFDPHEGHF